MNGKINTAHLHYTRNDVMKNPKDDRENTGDADGIGYYALRLAMTRNQAEEEEMKAELKSLGVKRFAVTEIGGNSRNTFLEKASNNIIGAALNNGLIDKTPGDLHALLHAAEEAKQGIILNSSSEVNLAVKAAVIRYDCWVAVAMFGRSAIHTLTGHERCGLGIMNI